jgi:alpha-ribazole phosphatase
LIYLLRHGAIEGDDKQRFIGQSDPPLSESGRRQARQWHRILGKIKFEAVFSSDLHRSEETAGIIAGEQQMQIRIVPNLREINLGHWQGRSMNWVRRNFPEKWRERGENFSGYRPPGGESFSDLHDRVIPVFEDLAAALRGDRLIVAHAGVNRIILCHVLGIPLANLFRLGQDYGALNIIDYRKNSPQVVGLNLQPRDFSGSF